MPELPEVEQVRRQLEPAMVGRRIEQVILRRAGLRVPFGMDFAERVEGQTVTAVRRRAKYLLVELSSGDVILAHLGMTGDFRVIADRPQSPNPKPQTSKPKSQRNSKSQDSKSQRGFRSQRDLTSQSETRGSEYYWQREALDKHDHVLFELSNGTTVVFNDPRRFGVMKVLSPAELAHEPSLRALGPEPLDAAFDAARLASALRGKKTSLKAALLDQRVVAGLGNIYAVEALHRVKLRPSRRASTIVARSGDPKPEAVALAKAIGDVLEDAIANSHRVGGPDRFRVYDREGARCPRRGCGGEIRRVVQGGRSTFYCRDCQR